MRYAAILLLALTMGCGDLYDHLFGPLREGPHRLQATTDADRARGHAVVACLEQWARASGYPAADYSDVRVDSLVIVRVGGDGVIGYYNGTSFQTDERQAGDTILINEGVSGTEAVALERHGYVHMAQSHRELIGADGDIHWPPPWDYCRVPRVIVGS